MSNEFPDYTNLRANMHYMKDFLNDSKEPIDAKYLQTIESIFNECDTEGKKDVNGKEIGDGELNEKERGKFLGALNKVLPEAVYQKVEDFIIAADVIEGLRIEKNIKNANKDINPE